MAKIVVGRLVWQYGYIEVPDGEPESETVTRIENGQQRVDWLQPEGYREDIERTIVVGSDDRTPEGVR